MELVNEWGEFVQQRVTSVLGLDIFLRNLSDALHRKLEFLNHQHKWPQIS